MMLATLRVFVQVWPLILAGNLWISGRRIEAGVTILWLLIFGALAIKERATIDQTIEFIRRQGRK